MLRFKPNEFLHAWSVPRIVIRPNPILQRHANASVPLLFNGPEVLTSIEVALVLPADLDLEEVYSLGSLYGRPIEIVSSPGGC